MTNAQPEQSGTNDDEIGLDRNFDQVDREAARTIGSDPPGGFATDIGGGSGEMDAPDQPDAAAGGTLDQ